MQLGFKTCDIFALFRSLVLEFGYCLMVSFLFFLFVLRHP